MMVWKFLNPEMTVEQLGYIPLFFAADDPRPAAEQLNERYAHGGGWRPRPPGHWLANSGVPVPHCAKSAPSSRRMDF